jgi:UDP-glucose 4-epimerase
MAEQKTRALVTGAAGFIGSHLCEELAYGGNQVTGLDDLSTGRLENLAGIRGRMTFLHGTVLDAAMVHKLVRDADVVYHLAAAVGTFTIRDRWLHSLHVNLDGTRNVVEAAAARAVPLLFTSSSEVYGTSQGSLAENAPRTIGSPLRPRWAYAEAKALDESFIAACAQEMGLKAVIARLFNVSGPRQSPDYGMVIPRFVRQALAGEPLTVFGTGDRTRCFCHVADVVPVLASLPFNPEAHGRAVNIGGGTTVSIRALAARVRDLAGSSSPVACEPLRDVMGENWDDMRRGTPDCTAARQLAGFKVSGDLDDIIRSVIEEQRALFRDYSPFLGFHRADKTRPERLLSRC